MYGNRGDIAEALSYAAWWAEGVEVRLPTFLAIDVGHSWCNSSGIAGEVIGALVEAIILEPDGVNTDSPLRGGRLTRRANSSPTRQWCALVQLIISSDRTFTVVSLGERLH